MRVSLALSGGGVRAMAHLGVIDVLEGAGIEIVRVSGSSGGALVGALYCDGHDSGTILDLARSLRWRDLFGATAPGGLFALRGVERLLESRLKSERIETLPRPLHVTCVDLERGEPLSFDRGPLATLCVASSALVPLFAPVRYGERLLADGGLMENLPVTPLQRWPEPIVGINVNPILPRRPRGLVSATLRSLYLMMGANIAARVPACHFLIEPPGCDGVNIVDLKAVDAAYEAGRAEAERVLPKLLDTLHAI